MPTKLHLQPSPEKSREITPEVVTENDAAFYRHWQRGAANDIRSTAQEAAAGALEITRSIQAVTAVARQTSECASQPVLAADELSRQSESLRLNAGAFLGDTHK